MATFTVINLNDSGAGSLRAAIDASNAGPPGVANTISFTVSGTIVLASDLATITNPTSIIAGSTDTGTPPSIGLDCNGNAGLTFGAGSDGSQLMGLAVGNADGNGVTLVAGDIILNNNYIGLALDGSAAGNSGDGVFVAATSSGNQIGYNPEAATLAANGDPATGVVSNVISDNGGHGISLHGSADNTIVSNRIGTSVDGNSALGNGGNGIWVTDGANDNTIGGTVIGNDASGLANNPTGSKGTVPGVFVTPPLGNLISGNSENGVLIDTNSQNNALFGNYIGTTASGNAALGNTLDGVAINGADFNSLHGCTVVDEPFVYYNVVSGNGGNGIHVTNSDHVTIRANFAGVGADNASIVANGNDGVLIDGSSRNTQVGGVIPLGNVIGGNANNGIEVADTASGFSTLNTFAGTLAFAGIAANGNNGILITSTGGNQTVQTNVISGNVNNGLEISGDAWGVTVVPNIIGLNTRGDGAFDFGDNFANGGHGILIAGNAHDNVIGGTGVNASDSVIRQNTISNNDGYGIVIADQAFNNVIADSAIGTDIQEVGALGNGAGGVLLDSTGSGNVVGTAYTGFSPLPAPAVRVNVISGNDGAGVELDPGTNFNAVINNWIGLDVRGEGSLPNSGAPIDDDGGTNLIYGNLYSGPVPVESPTAQLELLYVGWFGRAAAPADFAVRMEELLTRILDGEPIATAILAMSEDFATSPEEAEYAELAALVTPVIPTAEQLALARSFIDETFTNLFDRAVTIPERTFWETAFFGGLTPFSALVYEIATDAQGDDIAALNAKIQAASYFTQAFEAHIEPPTPAEMRAAVSGVTDATTFYDSQAATNALVGSSHDQVGYQTILSPIDIITGVRADYDGSVILTGSQGTSGSSATQPFLYQGPLNDTSAGTLHLLTPTFAGQTVTTGTLYGPDTAIFTPSIGLGNVRAVGSYQYAESAPGVINHGMIYQGRVDGTGGTWTQIDVPSNGVNVVGGVVIGTTVEDTILHSTQGNLVVGNYDLVGVPGSANGFIYNIATGQYTLLNINGSYSNFTSVYGIWQHGVGSTDYTIAGGSRNGDGVNVAFLQNYNSSTGIFSDLTFYSGFNQPGVITHFENITAVPGGFNLVATTDDGPAFVSVQVNPDGSFGEAVWTAGDLPGSNLMTGNIVYQNVFGGIYNTDDNSTVGSYLGVVDQSYVTAEGGLVMPVGSLNFAYALSVAASTGGTIMGSTVAGNVLGGSIGNDQITGTESTTASDTIYTGGGTDLITLAAGGSGRSRVELFAANALFNTAALTPGETVTAVEGSIVNAQDIPQLGWWGQATGQLGGPVSNAQTNLGIGTGTSQDMSTVLNFSTGSASNPLDMIDISLDAFSDLLRAADGNDAQVGAATFSNMVGLGGTITVADANVLLIASNVGFANAADLAAELLANPITFASTQTAQFNHYIVAYQDFDGDVRIADMNIHANGLTSFTTTAGGATLAISDMAELEGVALASLQSENIVFVSNDEIANSSYLDFTGYRIADATTVVEAYGLDQANVAAATTAGINVAIILDRVQDPTTLLSQNWGTRQATLAQLENNGTLWDTYGADQAQYDSVVSELTGTYGLTVLDGITPNGNYVSSAEARTIWVAIDTPAQFMELFGKTLYNNNAGDNSFLFWNGNLSLPSEWNVQGLWFDTDNAPPPSNMAPGVSVTLPQGPQSIGNTTASVPNMAPQDIAALYDFPLVGQSVATGMIALIEPGIGNAVRDGADGTFDQRLANYLQSIGETGTGTVFVQGDGQIYSSAASERSLDVGVVSAVNPNSNIGLYNGSGYRGNATASVFTALQSAIWDTANNPGVISNSFGDSQSMSPDSPFYQAYWQLYVDAALRNQTVFAALGDGGSGNETGNGLTNVEINVTSPYSVLVGGTSLSTLATAEADATLTSSVVAPALAGDRATIWQLMAGGLTSLPSDASALQSFVETVWNTYQVTGSTIGTSDNFYGGYLQNTTTSGGVDPTQPAPWYQTAYGLNPVTSDPLAQPGRGVPDVSANAGGNLQYLVPNGEMTENTGQIGTSAAAPFWAALTVQFNAIFADQDLPQLGYMTDLLYIASAIAPAAFNDVTLGGNMSSFTMGGTYSTLNADGTAEVNVTPTGYGYYAGPGYDLVSGLGSPNGLLLARALTTIAHSQISYSSSPDMLDADGSGWESGAEQSLLFQTMSGSGASIGLDLGSDILSFTSVGTGTYAWTNRLAQQSMQDDFDPNLVRLFDKFGQGAMVQSTVSQGENVAVSINASAADAIQGALSSPFGFADFVTDSGVVRVARPVALAETVGGLDDQTAIVRVRQNGEDSLSVTFYRVDDLSGSIDGLSAGQAGYAQAAQGRAYQIAGGGTSIGGPGYGNYGQAALIDVDAGDMIAMKLVNQTTNNTYWAFAPGNEAVSGQSVGHLWNYGLNTWGWEDTRNGGDRDFNDLIVQFDFTSAYGNNWLV
jgi:hypothetical protein